MHLELLDKATDFHRIKAAWEALCVDSAGSLSVFASPEWYETWWRHYSADATLHMVAMWDAGRLAGLAPLMLRKVTIHGLPATAVCFIGNKQSLHNDFVVLPAGRDFFLRELLRFLFKHSARWQIIAFRNLPAATATALVKTVEETGRKWRQHPTCFDSPCLVPSGTWEDYLASRTTRTRKGLRHIRNNMDRAGEVTVRNIRTWAEFQEVKDEVFEVARQSWTEKRGDSLASPANEQFFCDLAFSSAAKGWLSLWTLSLNGKMVAIEFHLRAYGKEHAMRGHYLPEFASLSPGTYLEMQILRNVFEETERVTTYDFCGSFESYKRKWTDSYVSHCDVEIFGNTPHARLIAAHETKLVPLLKGTFPDNIWNHKMFRICGINTRRMDTVQGKTRPETPAGANDEQ